MTWILLVITYGQDPDAIAYVPFRNAMQCGNALPVIHNAIKPEWPDAMLQCQTTDVPLVRPRARTDQ